MKKKIFIYMLLLLPAFLCQSCLKDQEDLFDKDAGLRVQELANSAEKTLNNSEHGWVLNYFPDESQQYGGYAYTLQFEDGIARVGFELEPGKFEESEYSLKSYSSATLSFDTYNSLMHHFATPSSGHTQGYHGDFEFTIDSVGENVVKVRGVRNKNVLYFTKLDESAEDYLAKVEKVSDEFFLPNYTGTVGTGEAKGTVDVDNRQLTITYNDGASSQKRPYVFTDKGIRFYEPMTINGGTLQEMEYDTQAYVLTGVTSKGETVSLQGQLPENYVHFDDYAGDYTFSYWDKPNGGYYMNVSVTLVPSADKKSYLMKGLNDKYDIVLNYNKTTGVLEMKVQDLAEVDGKTLVLAAWIYGGSSSWGKESGMVTVWNGDAEHPEYQFASNSFKDFVADSFTLRFRDASGNYSQVPDSYTSWYIKGYSHISQVGKLVKK